MKIDLCGLVFPVLTVLLSLHSAPQAAPAFGAASSDTPPSDNQLKGGVTAQSEVQVIDSQTDDTDSEVAAAAKKRKLKSVVWKGWK